MLSDTSRRADHQLLDAAEHGVEALRQAVELVARAVERDALARDRRHDRAARLGDGLDAAQHAAADGEAGADAEQRRAARCSTARAGPWCRRSGAGPRCRGRRSASARPEPAAARRRHGAARGLALLAGARVVEDGALPCGLELRRHAIEIAGDLAARGIDQKVEARARLARQRWAMTAARRSAPPAWNCSRRPVTSASSVSTTLLVRRSLARQAMKPTIRRRRQRRRRPCRRASGETGSS